MDGRQRHHPDTYNTTSRSRQGYWAMISDRVMETKCESQYGTVGRLTVEVTIEDEAFLATRCGTWVKVGR
jgi:hypothetical protein